ncbi:MAG: B12-binding domain-containing radical SAM protein [Chloroflexi bacterium]|nr:B12-binding domain-containing radical SAM protein [Chloroflexota bacterium]
MKVCLVNTNVNLLTPDFLRFEIQPGLVSIGAVLEKNGFTVEIVDLKLLILENNWKADGHIFKKAASFIAGKDPDLVGINTRCDSFPTAINIAKALKDISPKTPVALGGIQATFVGKETMEAFPFVDFILRGEAEYSFAELAGRIQKKGSLRNIKGLTYRKDGDIIENPAPALFPGLDNLPEPAYHLYKSQLASPELNARREIYIDAGRGCPYHCKFCVCHKMYNGKYRLKSPGKVVSEIKNLKNTYGINGFNIGADHFLVDKKYVKRFCELLIRENLGITWCCSARPENIDEEILRLMKKSGLFSVFLGIETGSETVQENIGKRLRLENIMPLMELLDSLEIFTVAAFIAGFPEETEKDINDTLMLAVDCSKFQNVYCEIRELAAMAGSAVYDRVKDSLRRAGFFNDIADGPLSGIPANMALVKKYPRLFSVFYSVPLKSMTPRLLHETVRFYNNALHHFPLSIKTALEELKIRPVKLFKLFRIWARKEGLSGGGNFLPSHADIINSFPGFLKDEYKKNGIPAAFINLILKTETAGAKSRLEAAASVITGLGEENTGRIMERVLKTKSGRVKQDRE